MNAAEPSARSFVLRSIRKAKGVRETADVTASVNRRADATATLLSLIHVTSSCRRAHVPPLLATVTFVQW